MWGNIDASETFPSSKGQLFWKRRCLSWHKRLTCPGMLRHECFGLRDAVLNKFLPSPSKELYVDILEEPRVVRPCWLNSHKWEWSAIKHSDWCQAVSYRGRLKPRVTSRDNTESEIIIGGHQLKMLYMSNIKICPSFVNEKCRTMY